MLIALVIILLLIWAAVVSSIYSNFTVFYSNFAESQNYHRAYYSSISALERAELVIKQRQPWFEWNWWWIMDKNTSEWSFKDWWSDKVISNFSYLSNDESSKNTSTIFWDIKSRTTRIPAEWNGDIDSMLSYTDSGDPSNSSKNFNMMDYKDSQVFLLYYDNWMNGTERDNPYHKISCKNWNTYCTQSSTEEITWIIRLPWKLKDFFGPLDTTVALVAGWPLNDAIVDRQIRWRFKENNTTESYPFTIYSTQIYDSNGARDDLDSAIRETDINGSETNPEFNFNFWQGKWSPSTDTSRWLYSNFTIISPLESNIKTDVNYNSTTKTTTKHFEQILRDSKYTEKQVRFSLLNLLRSEKNMVYPFLEYYVDFWTDISDKYFTINAEWNYDNYQIDRIVWKPTNKESILWSFTTIF